MRAAGADYLTEAFQRFGALASDNRVTRIVTSTEVSGGSTGRKLVLDVEYRTPGPCRRLFVKFSRDFDDPVRDHGRSQMASEIRFAALVRSQGAADFPVVVPTAMFADYHLKSGTGVLVTERIPFGANGIERQYEKCMDDEMPDQFGHYLALVGAVARLAGTDAAGRLPNDLPADMEKLSVGERAPLTADRLIRRVDRLVDFTAAYPGLLPVTVASPSFLARLRTDLSRLLDAEPRVWRHLREERDFTALCHWNANVDNAWFWRDADDTLRCGLMDWGCVGQMNVAMAIWGALCSAETQMWDDHLGDLLTHFIDEFRACGGRPLGVDDLLRHVVLYAAVMSMTWLMDVPTYVRSQVPNLDASSTRMDPDIRGSESVRCRLQMMTNALHLLERNDFGRLLDEIV